eukprot:2757098-Prorocentrum_lima.AAC.1
MALWPASCYQQHTGARFLAQMAFSDVSQRQEVVVLMVDVEVLTSRNPVHESKKLLYGLAHGR